MRKNDDMRKFLGTIAVLLFVIAVAASMIRGCNNNERTEQVQLPAATEIPQRSITITACGDCTLATDINADPDGSFVEYAESEDYSYFFEKVRSIFEEDDLTIVNFEGTLSKQGTRQDKTFAFRGDPSYVNILTTSSVEAANLANNHSKDYGDISFEDTKKYLEEAGVLHFFGTDVCVEEINGISVGLVGINALNDVEVTKLEKSIAKAKELGAELVILSIHWGIEKATEPNDEQIELAHTAIDCGADLVLGTHPHVLQGIEKYNGRYIFYSMGNFCFGGNNNPSDKNTAIWRQTFTFNGDVLEDDDNFEVIPCRISGASGYNNYQPVPATGEVKTNIEDKLQGYTDKLGNVTLNFR